MTSPELVLCLDFDGTLYVGDLPVQAYARHVAEQLPPAAARTLMDGLRTFLEGRSVGASDVDLAAAEDGYHAVELLATAAGVGTADLGGAYRRSRHDLAASAFAIDAPAGLVELLTALRGRAHVAVVTNADPPGVAEVLAATGLAPLVDEVCTGAGKPAGMGVIVDRLFALLAGRPDAPGRFAAVGDRWCSDLAQAHRIGGVTGYVDRFGRGDGRPTWRAATTAELVPRLASWAAGITLAAGADAPR